MTVGAGNVFCTHNNLDQKPLFHKKKYFMCQSGRSQEVITLRSSGGHGNTSASGGGGRNYWPQRYRYDGARALPEKNHFPPSFYTYALIKVKMRTSKNTHWTFLHRSIPNLCYKNAKWRRTRQVFLPLHGYFTV